MHQDEPQLTFWGHALVLRNYLLFGAVFFIITALVVYSFATNTLIVYLLRPLNGEPLVFLTPLGPFLFKIRVTLYGTLLISLPVWLGLILYFIAPVFSFKKHLALMGFVLSSFILGLGAVVITYYYIMPTSFTFLQSIVVPGTSFFLSADAYVNFFLMECVVALIVLELPLIINLLAYAQILNPKHLTSRRRMLYLGLLIFLAVVTPTVDAFTLCVVFIPSVLFVEIGLLTARMLYNRKYDTG